MRIRYQYAILFLYAFFHVATLDTGTNLQTYDSQYYQSLFRPSGVHSAIDSQGPKTPWHDLLEPPPVSAAPRISENFVFRPVFSTSMKDYDVLDIISQSKRDVVYLIIHTKTGQVSYAQVTHLQKRLDELEVKYGMDFKHHDYDEIGAINFLNNWNASITLLGDFEEHGFDVIIFERLYGNIMKLDINQDVVAEIVHALYVLMKFSGISLGKIDLKHIYRSQNGRVVLGGFKNVSFLDGNTNDQARAELLRSDICQLLYMFRGCPQIPSLIQALHEVVTSNGVDAVMEALKKNPFFEEIDWTHFETHGVSDVSPFSPIGYEDLSEYRRKGTLEQLVLKKQYSSSD